MSEKTKQKPGLVCKMEDLFNFLAKFEDSHKRLCRAVPVPAEMNLDFNAKKPTRSVSCR